jgi:hypothetical protein
MGDGYNRNRNGSLVYAWLFVFIRAQTGLIRRGMLPAGCQWVANPAKDAIPPYRSAGELGE